LAGNHWARWFVQCPKSFGFSEKTQKEGLQKSKQPQDIVAPDSEKQGSAAA